MWLELSEGIFFFGPGGITAIKDIDLRDKPESYIFKTELYANNNRIGIVKETSEYILKELRKEK